LELFGRMATKSIKKKKPKGGDKKQEAGAKPVKKKDPKPVFKDVPFYLLLNKKDLFETMLRKVGLEKTFPDYKGSSRMSDALDFIKNKFMEKVPAEKKAEVTIHDITGTSRKDVKDAFYEIEKDLLERKYPILSQKRKEYIEEQKRLEAQYNGSGKCVIS
jgi:hypothetical protein